MLCCGRIGQNRKRLLRLVPVVVPIENLYLRLVLVAQWAEVPGNEARTLRRVQTHPGIVARLVVRLVLHCQREDRNALARVSVDVSQQVACEGILMLGQQRTLNEATSILHPRRCAPWRGHDLQVRIDLQHLTRNGDHILLVDVDTELPQLRIRLSVQRIVETVVAA